VLLVLPAVHLVAQFSRRIVAAARELAHVEELSVRGNPDRVAARVRPWGLGAAARGEGALLEVAGAVLLLELELQLELLLLLLLAHADHSGTVGARVRLAAGCAAQLAPVLEQLRAGDVAKRILQLMVRVYVLRLLVALAKSARSRVLLACHDFFSPLLSFTSTLAWFFGRCTRFLGVRN